MDADWIWQNQLLVCMNSATYIYHHHNCETNEVDTRETHLLILGLNRTATLDRKIIHTKPPRTSAISFLSNAATFHSVSYFLGF